MGTVTTKLLLIFFSLALCSCDNSSSPENTMATSIRLGTPITELLQKTSLPFKQDCLREADVCWHEFSTSANSSSLPNITLATQNTQLSFEAIPTISIFEGPNSNGLVQNSTIRLRGLPDNTSHEAQKALIYSTIDKIENAGWKRFIYFYDPRISGKETQKLATANDVMGVLVMNHPWFDPNIQLNIRQWLSVKGLYEWYFVDDHDNHLKLTAQRHDSESAPELRGTYLITIEVDTEQSFWMKEFEESDKPNWIKLLPEKLKAFRAQRTSTEQKAVAGGVMIDTTYQDPVIQALE